MPILVIISQLKKRSSNLKLLSVLLLSFIHLFAISAEQLHILQTVRDVARTIPNKQGLTYENTISAICLTESSAGKHIIGDVKHGKKLTKASLGVMQIQVATARFVGIRVPNMAWIANLSDIQVANRILSDIEFSARVAAHYLVMLNSSRKDYFKTVSGYNGGMRNYPYYSKVMKNMNLVRKLVKHGKIS